MNKVIIIGATSGIGKQLAQLYATNNWLVGVTGRRRALLDSLQKDFPDNILTECFDVTGEENVECMKNLIQQLGGLDLLIYNSGYGESSTSLNWEIDKNTTRINVNGFAEIVNFAFNYFVVEGKGHIAATSSIAAIRGNSFAPAYSASKAYMSNYLEGLYIKAYKLNLPVYITDIRPGFIKTKMAKGDGQFWVAPVEKAAAQIYTGISRKKRKLYITKRWQLVAWLLNVIPIGFYKKIG
ncbi:SDR family NAD(P)-dependent oxidoreductase [Ferruginibacter sp.]|jgi:short-subunit dehydrogenase|uniref:SDR family NAD(P)-dependent oxidoreductase n=1 Tax=Ferruginibacter sp. TaxID=1940288 RepID=UPI0019954250|nr:SDR family NAD(P)-dependent oxidoreductase [Ferruginibacter sp.]MBC7629074.1 SDR family NAD(P)-dependent oxidoreductase [Ferruginibacter sp.]